MRTILTFILIALVWPATAQSWLTNAPGTIMESNGVVMKPVNFWRKAQTNDLEWLAVLEEIFASFGGGGTGDLKSTNNLSDVTSTSQSRTNLGAHNADNLTRGTVLESLIPHTFNNPFNFGGRFYFSGTSHPGLVLKSLSSVEIAALNDTAEAGAAVFDTDLLRPGVWTSGQGSFKPLAFLEDVGGGGTWGSITGTLSAQTDLQAALDAKDSVSSVNAKTNALEAAYAAADTAASNALVLQIASKQYGTAALTNLSNGNGAALTNINAIFSILTQNGATNITITLATNGTTGAVAATFDLSRTGTGAFVGSNGPVLQSVSIGGSATLGGIPTASMWVSNRIVFGSLGANNAYFDGQTWGGIFGQQSYITVGNGVVNIGSASGANNFTLDWAGSLGNIRLRNHPTRGVIVDTLVTATNGYGLVPLVNLPTNAISSSTNQWLLWLPTNGVPTLTRTNPAGAGLFDTNKIVTANGAGNVTVSGSLAAGSTISATDLTSTNGVLHLARTTSPTIANAGAYTWSDGTNFGVTLRNGGGVNTTNQAVLVNPSTVETSAFTNAVAARMPIVISGTTYYLTLSTNVP